MWKAFILTIETMPMRPCLIFCGTYWYTVFFLGGPPLTAYGTETTAFLLQLWPRSTISIIDYQDAKRLRRIAKAEWWSILSQADYNNAKKVLKSRVEN